MTEAALLDAVRRAPSDDGARLVWADWLIERGDPLGPLIVADCYDPVPPRAERIRRDAAYAAMSGRLLGDAAGHLVPLAFRRGGVADALDLGSATVPLVGEWPVVEHLRTDRAPLVVAFGQRGLRSVDLGGLAAFAELLAHDEPTSLVAVWPLRVGGAIEALPRGPGALAALEDLALVEVPGPRVDLPGLVEQVLELALPLRRLVVHGALPPDPARWERHPTLERVDSHGRSWVRPGRVAPAPPPVLPPVPEQQRDRGWAMDPLHPQLWLSAGPDGAAIGMPVGPAPWDPALVAAVQAMIARTDAANPDTPLDEAALERLVLGPDGRPVLLALPTPTGVGPQELQRQLALRGRVDARSWAGASVCGLLRAANEDTFGVGDGVWAVVDGMGAGSWAAPAACIVASTLCEPGDDATRFADAASRLGTAPLAADATAVRLRIDGDGAHVAWLGDCRAGQLRDGVLSWRTTDHSLVTRMVEAGRISAAEAEHHPHRNILVRMVSAMDAEPPSMFTVPIVPGDRWVLASDGVWRAVPAEQLAACILRAASLQDAVWQVLYEACRRDGSDNATVVIVAC